MKRLSVGLILSLALLLSTNPIVTIGEEQVITTGTIEPFGLPHQH